jgi:trehalose 6-phosphate phosphatase
MSSAPSAAAEHDVPPPPRADVAPLALFVDVDGTLLDFAARPDAVVVDAALPATLQRLKRRLSGALAPVSGRPLREVDALLGLDGAAAGLHGAELRASDGFALEAPIASERLDAARRQAARAASIPGVLVEDKRNALALHYRAVPDAELDVRRIASAMLDAAGDGYELLHGAFVFELKPSNVDKGTAVAALMRVAPFAGRAPWVIGDDVTDEDAFAEANARGGVSIIVGSRRPTAARYGLPGPAAARDWLAALADGTNAESQR